MQATRKARRSDQTQTARWTARNDHSTATEARSQDGQTNGSLEIMDTNRWASPCNIKYASCTGRRPHHPNQRLSQGHVDRAPTSQGKGEATATNLDSKHTEYFSADPRKTDRVRHPRQSSSTEDWDEMPTQRALQMERMRSRAPTARVSIRSGSCARQVQTKESRKPKGQDRSENVHVT
jgi:hypothetical protein